MPHDRRSRPSGRMRGLFVSALILAIVIGQQLFFSFGFIAQTVLPSFDIEGLYSLYLAVLAVFAFSLFFKRVIADGCALPNMGWALLCLVSIIAVSALIHRSEYRSVWDFFAYFVLICLPALAVGITLEQDMGREAFDNIIKLVDPAMTVITLAVCAYELSNYAEGFTSRALAGVSYQQVSYMGALAFGMNCAMLLTGREHRRYRLFRTRMFWAVQRFMLAIQAICVVLSGGRGGFVLMCVYGIMFLFHFAKKTGRNAFGVVILPSILLLFFAFLASGVIDLSGIVDTRGFERIFTFRDNRSEVFGSALEIISEHILFGCGVGGYFVDLGAYPHNIILELLLNWGVFGLIAAVAIFLFAAKSLFRLCAADGRFMPLSYIGMSPVVFLMFSSSFMANATIWFFIGLAFSPLSLNCRQSQLMHPSIEASGSYEETTLHRRLFG